ncbi:MAG: PepSY domain-containing protein [Aquificaceae bacterium]|nr:PepSY domain-containing protein [Aquificaceae bacterium]MDW8236782.1 PepSY domain-containing protein [Aquificaceae bacterium]
MKIAVLALFFSLAFAEQQCIPAISIEQAINAAKQQVGSVQGVTLSQSKKTGECAYRVRGSEGTALIDAKDGKLIRFSRKR